MRGNKKGEGVAASLPRKERRTLWKAAQTTSSNPTSTNNHRFLRAILFGCDYRVKHFHHNVNKRLQGTNNTNKDHVWFPAGRPEVYRAGRTSASARGVGLGVRCRGGLPRPSAGVKV